MVVVLIALVILAVTFAAVALIVSARTRRAQRNLESWVLDALDVLDAEYGDATDAKRIISEARGGKLVQVPPGVWAARKLRDNKRTTGVLVALAIMTSTGVVARQRYDDPEPAQKPDNPASILTTVSPSTTTTAASSTTATSTPATTAAGEPSQAAPQTTAPSTTTTTTSTPPTTLLPDELSLIVSLQLSDELQASVVGEIGAVHDLADVVAGQVGDDLSSTEDTLEMIERCLSGDVPSPTDNCPPL